MKNITIALDDETYRLARIVAAQRDASVSALVKNYLLTLVAETPAPRNLKQEQETLLDTLWQRHPHFTPAENLPRTTLYDERR